MKRCNSDNTPNFVKEAKHLWFLSAMGETVEAQNAGKLRELDIKDVNGLKVICGRASVGVQNFFGSNFELSNNYGNKYRISLRLNKREILLIEHHKETHSTESPKERKEKQEKRKIYAEKDIYTGYRTERKKNQELIEKYS